VTLDRVPGPAADGQPRGERQHEDARRPGRRRQRERVQGDTRQRLLAAGAQQVHVVTAGDQRGEEPGGGTLDTAVEDERA
jgi:hypothetical protein